MTNKSLKNFPEFIQKLEASELLFIVEGKKDERALRKLKVENIEVLKGPIFSFIERIAKSNRKVVILTDLDSEGKKLYSILTRGLSERGVIIDNYFREYLFNNTKLRQIEGLDSYISKSEIFRKNSAKR
ncbi:MAG TPA: toprim domain-containing protein [Candidatus Nanoarchaeia archaeon]|nr:toprim domain-containing protein [Candidatus Nanoarchaeia archaeon]